MLRNLGCFEKIIYWADQVTSCNFVIIANLTGRMSKEALRQSLDKIQPIYPFLNVSVKEINSEFIFWKNSLPIPLRSVSRQSDLQWLDELKIELNTSFTSDAAPLIRVVYLHSENQHELLITFHHVIADGLSGIHFLYHLMTVVDQIMENKNIAIGDSLRLLPPVEELLNTENKYSNEDQPKHLSNVCIKQADINSTISTAVLPFQLSRAETERIISISTSNHVTVHSLLCSAMCITQFERKLLNLTRLTCLSPVNMRPYLPCKVDMNEMGYILSRIDIQQIYHPERNILDNAKIIHSQIKDLIDINAHVEFINGMHDILDQTFLIKNSHKSTTQFKMPCVFISNMGNLKFNDRFSNFTVKNSHFSIACQGIMGNKNSMAATTVTINTQMSINFHYLEPWVTRTEAENFANAVIKKLVTL